MKEPWTIQRLDGIRAAAIAEANGGAFWEYLEDARAVREADEAAGIPAAELIARLNRKDSCDER